MFSSALWLLFKSSAINLGKFILANWRIILVALILWYCLNAYLKQVALAESEKIRADKAVAAFATYKDDIAKETIKRKSEDLAKKLLGEKNDAIAAAAHKADMDRLNLDRARETKNLKDLYEARNDTTKHNFVERLHLDAERNRLGMSESVSDTSRPAEGERECDGAYTTLERACQITTVDFNQCRAWMDNVCLTIGCEVSSNP